MNTRVRNAVHRSALAITMCAIVILIAWLYWPTRHSGFVWDDTSSLHDNAALRGDAWKEAVFRGFNGWINYFRPLVVLLFVVETRAFDVMPGPMHLVSLSIHLADTLLVGLLALRLSRRQGTPLQPVLIAAASMLSYGLHPALIEPVDWVGCQFELLLIFFILLGLLLNAAIRSSPRRALAVGLCFLLAAGFKEAAIAFPPLLVLLDLAAARETDWPARLRATWQRQRLVYAAVLLGGIVYLAVRCWALGYVVLPSGAEPLLSLPRLQRVCLTYLSYWKLIIWPMTSIGPVHSVDERLFTNVTTQSLAVDAAAVVIVLGGMYAYWKRQPLGTVILAVSIALFPVLNLVPIGFNEDLYHDRYATTAVAMACLLLPSVLAPLLARMHLANLVVPLVVLVWLGFAVVNIRVTVPLWADELSLWRWALQQAPDSITAKDRLLATYIGRNDDAHARELADTLVAENASCPVCMLNAAHLAITENDATRAALALSKVKDLNILAYNNDILQAYVFASGQLLELQGDLPGAEEAYRDAITLKPQDPLPRFNLAFVLARQGRITEARYEADLAIAQFPPDEREQRRHAFDQALVGTEQH